MKTFKYFLALAAAMIFMVVGTLGIVKYSQSNEKQERSLFAEYDYVAIFAWPYGDKEPWLSPTRVEHEGQLDLEDLQTGMIVTAIQGDSVSEVLILRGPYMLDGKCRYDSVYLDHINDNGWITQDYCTDAGLVAYDMGWNPTNHLLPTSHKQLTIDQVNELIKSLRFEPGYQRQLPFFQFGT